MGKVGGDSRGLVGRGEAGEGLTSVHMRPRTSNESETQTHTHWAEIALKVKVAQLCLTLCDSMGYIYSPWNSPGQNTGVGSLSLLQGIFPTQESNSGLLYCRQILY